MNCWLKNKALIAVLSLLSANSLQGQKVQAVVKVDDLLQRLSHHDTTYVVNFWAVWCKPCVQELPAFDSLHTRTKGTNVRVLLVTLDFKEDLEKKVNPFLVKKGIAAPCLLLDETGGEFIDRLSPEWSGAIPATLFVKGKKKFFVGGKMHLAQIQEVLENHFQGR